MMRAPRACPSCGRPNCTAHAAKKRASRAAQRRDDLRRPRNYSEQKRHREMIAEWVALWGWVCPGDGPAHPSHLVRPGQLTVDHVIPVRHSGDPNFGPERILCRSRNSSLGAGLAGKKGP